MTGKPTKVALLLDESGSMGSTRDMTLSALGEYIHQLQQDATIDIAMSIVTFSGIRTVNVCKDVPIKAVDIDAIKAHYKPSGGTPLIDAAVKLIRATEKVVTAENVICVIQTDGQENSSTEFKLADLQALIKEKSDAGWQFVFLGADIDAYETASQLGISRGSTMSYTQSIDETQSAFGALAQNTRAYVSGQSATMDWTEQQKADAGDKFAHGKPPEAELPKTRASLVGDIDV